MKLSNEAQTVLEKTMNANKVSEADREEINHVIHAMPDDRVLL